ncbi:MAG: nucleotidyl transferase AbiEii/AbiGii toxin family protein [Chloroflexota bacterium]|nr:nucleotidyl transferase AbiEii/AbiGii toxin family protein [Chloroflexota bacterium]
MNDRFLLPEAHVIEFLHLAFLQVLQARLDQSRYVLKGGANLRYFFGSLRYSEDIDLDAVGIDPWKLEAKVDEVLASPAISLLLRGGGLVLHQVTKPKQTGTTQRWKPVVTAAGSSVLIRTKIEFSHRHADPRRILEAIPERVVAPYALRPPTLLHYTAEAAIEQKVEALAHRSETQARDLFDLELLLRRHPDAVSAGAIPPDTLVLAEERAFDLPFRAFQDQVVRFLEVGIVELYDDPAVWDRTQTFVTERLSELRP